jgi:hypothetical protein
VVVEDVWGRWWSYFPSQLEDGWGHVRIGGICVNCGATQHEPHYRLKPKEEN